MSKYYSMVQGHHDGEEVERVALTPAGVQDLLSALAELDADGVLATADQGKVMQMGFERAFHKPTLESKAKAKAKRQGAWDKKWNALNNLETRAALAKVGTTIEEVCGKRPS